MPHARTAGRRIRFALALLLSAASVPALAQYPAGATVQPLPRDDDPAELLAQALRTLAVEPNNVAALTAAGHNALTLGDPNAAVGFFGRASGLAPRDGRVKAGLGSALVQLEKPVDALRLFGEASALGVPEADIAEDRGLAYDLTGDSRRAQHDYAMVLAAHPDDDTARRRLGLSQGIAGDKNGAIATLDPLIRRRDIAGWRAQTFVLAMNGDAAGASYITHIMMPQQADKMQPFLVRLAALSPVDKARAVHFGEMPQGGSSYTPTQLAAANAPTTYAPAPATSTPAAKPSRHRIQEAAAPQNDLAPAPAVAVPTPASPPSQQRTQLAAATPSDLAPPVREQAVPTPAPAPTPEPAPIPAPMPAAAPERVAVTGDAPTGQAGRFIGPPTDLAPKPEAVAAPAPVPETPPTRVAAAATSAPLAGTAFGGEATSAPSQQSPPASLPAIRPTPLPESSPPPAVRDAAPAIREPAPVAAPPPATPKPRAVVRKAPEAAPVEIAPEAAPKATRSGRAAGKAKDQADDEATPPARSARAGKAAHAADADDTGDAPARGKRGSRKDKAYAAARDDETTSGKAGKKSTGASAEDAGGSKSKKGAKADESDGDTGRKGGKSGGKAAKSETRSAKSEETGPSKVYVQVAGGANKDDMDKAWADVKKKAPDLMKGHSPSTTPLKATNRLLVGPFKSDEEAQAFVNKMAGKGLSGFTFKSAKGQKVEKVDAGK